MTFQGYTQETVDFLWGIRFNNERGWFMDHKQDYQDHLLSPTRALAEQVYDAALPTRSRSSWMKTTTSWSWASIRRITTSRPRLPHDGRTAPVP